MNSARPGDLSQPRDLLGKSLSRPLSYLEVEDPGVVFLEALVYGDDASQDLFVQGEGGDGCQ